MYLKSNDNNPITLGYHLGKLSLDPWQCVNEIEERVSVSLVDFDSSLYQLLLSSPLSAMDNDSTGDVELLTQCSD